MEMVNGERLFDLETDLYESKDLSEEFPEIVGKLSSKYQQIKQQVSGNNH